MDLANSQEEESEGLLADFPHKREPLVGFAAIRDDLSRNALSRRWGIGLKRQREMVGQRVALRDTALDKKASCGGIPIDHFADAVDMWQASKHESFI